MKVQRRPTVATYRSESTHGIHHRGHPHIGHTAAGKTTLKALLASAEGFRSPVRCHAANTVHATSIHTGKERPFTSTPHRIARLAGLSHQPTDTRGTGHPGQGSGSTPAVETAAVVAERRAGIERRLPSG